MYIRRRPNNKHKFVFCYQTVRESLKNHTKILKIYTSRTESCREIGPSSVIFGPCDLSFASTIKGHRVPESLLETVNYRP